MGQIPETHSEPSVSITGTGLMFRPDTHTHTFPASQVSDQLYRRMIGENDLDTHTHTWVPAYTTTSLLAVHVPFLALLGWNLKHSGSYRWCCNIWSWVIHAVRVHFLNHCDTADNSS